MPKASVTRHIARDKQTLIDLQNILNDKFPIKLKIGKHYGALQ